MTNAVAGKKRRYFIGILLPVYAEKEERFSRLLKKLFSLPLADARGSPAFPNRDREGVARSVFV